MSHTERSGTSTSSPGQPENAPSPIDCKLAGRAIRSRAEQPEKAFLPISVTPSGMRTDFIPAQPEKVTLSIFVTPSEIMTDSIPVQSANAYLLPFSASAEKTSSVSFSPPTYNSQLFCIQDARSVFSQPERLGTSIFRPSGVS